MVETTGRLRPGFAAQLDELFRELVTMAVSCSEILHLAVQTLITQDLPGVQTVLQKDDAIDEQERHIEAQAIRLLTLQQPVLASDLRVVNMTLRAITDLERIGDHSVNIARIVRKMTAARVTYQPLVDVERLERLVAVMLEDTIQALVRRDVVLARSVIRADDEVDVLYQEMQRDLRERMLSGEPGIVARASYLLFVVHYLERIGDHCVGIAERLLYLTTGHVPSNSDTEEE